jgi:hypothetical protein
MPSKNGHRHQQRGEVQSTPQLDKLTGSGEWVNENPEKILTSVKLFAVSPFLFIERIQLEEPTST